MYIYVHIRVHIYIYICILVYILCIDTTYIDTFSYIYNPFINIVWILFLWPHVDSHWTPLSMASSSDASPARPRPQGKLMELCAGYMNLGYVSWTHCLSKCTWNRQWPTSSAGKRDGSTRQVGCKPGWGLALELAAELTGAGLGSSDPTWDQPIYVQSMLLLSGPIVHVVDNLHATIAPSLATV